MLRQSSLRRAGAMARSISQRYPSYLRAEPVCEYKASFKESSEAVRSPLLFFRTLLNHSVPAETNGQHSKPRGVHPEGESEDIETKNRGFTASTVHRIAMSFRTA